MKMTKIRQEQLRYRVMESRARLMHEYPFFGIILMYLRFVAVRDIRTISIDVENIYFNADYIDKLTDIEFDFLLCHQVMHIVNGDIWRSERLLGDDYHRACDILANDQLIKMGWAVSRFHHLGKLQYEVPGYSGDLREFEPADVMKAFPFSLRHFDDITRRKYMIDTDKYWNAHRNLYYEGIIIVDIPKLSKIIEKPKIYWAGKIGMAAGVAKKMGKLPMSAKRFINQNQKKAVDWRKVLNEFVQSQVVDYSFLPPDKRYSEFDFFLPDFNEKEFETKTILFMADTSGSIKEIMLGRVYSEISGAIEQFHGKLKGKLGFFDCAVTEPIKFENVDELSSIIPYGGGGTSFEVVFDYVRECMDEDIGMIVIFTDGYAHFPEESVAMNIPVLWLITNNEVHPPWGKVGRIVE